jgi:hypothetical protein
LLNVVGILSVGLGSVLVTFFGPEGNGIMG